MAQSAKTVKLKFYNIIIKVPVIKIMLITTERELMTLESPTSIPSSPA